MKYSFIFCYRNREEHLNITIPKIWTYLNSKNLDFELIVVEQNDTLPFRRGNLLNTGVQFSDGELVVLHDIDHIPIQGDYWDERSDVFLPIRKVEFRTNTLELRPVDDIPPGYRNFHIAVDNDYFGGVITFVKSQFLKINGFNYLFRGWGFEDADLRERIIHHRLTVSRSISGSFYALEHADNGLPPSNPDLQRNIKLWQQYQTNLDRGILNQPQVIEHISPKHPLVNKWILASEYEEKTIFEKSIVSSKLL